jgi:fucose 4-O-acetylase-like acetyltransferase
MASLVSVLVILAHAQGQPRADVRPEWIVSANAFMNGAVSLLRMPLFFFVSGFLFLHTNPLSRPLRYREFIQKKALRLLLPYWVLTTVAFPIKAWLSQYALRPVSFSFGEYAASLVDPAKTPIMF